MSGFLLPDEELRMQQGSLAPAIEPSSSSAFLLPGEQTAPERAAATLRKVIPIKPDTAAETRRLSTSTGVPEPVVERNLDTVKTEARLREIQDAMRASPILARQLTDPKFAALAHDDVQNLTDVDKIVASKGPKPTIASYHRGLAEAFWQGLDATRQGLRMQFADAFNLTAMRDDAARKAASASHKTALTTPDFESDTAKGIYSGLTSTVQQAPALVVSALTGNPLPALGAIGVQSEAQAYTKYRARGASPVLAGLGALGEGATEVLTEALPMSFLVKKLGKTGAGEFLVGLLAREIPSEQIATIVQDAIDTAIANPDKTWRQYVDERPAAAYQTLVATITQAGVMAGTGAAMRKLSSSAPDEANQNADAVEQLLKLAEASKVRERDPSSFEAYVNAAAEEGPVQNIHVNAAVFAQAAGEKLPELGITIPSVGSQMAEALATGGDLVIPIGEFAANIPGTGLEASLLDHIRTGPDQMTRAEAKTFMQSGAEELKQHTEKIIAAHAVDDAFKQSAAKVEADLLKQIKGTNRFTDDVNKPYAQLAGAFYQVQAARLGVTPEEMYTRYPLKVAAQSVAGGRTLDQSNRGQISFADDITKLPSTITLLQNADLSTFVHELGHFNLEVLSHIAAQPGAPVEIAADVEALLKWFGVKDLATWSSMSANQKRSHHEQFARGFEAYLFEGKAPNQTLDGIFARMRAWMINVYKQLTALNVTLTDEVRAVIDRMIATNEQILAAEAARGYAPLFKSAQEMGATEAEWKAYQAQGQEQTQEAVNQLQSSSLRDMRWLSNARSRVIQDLQKEAATKRKAIVAEVTAEVRQQPVYAVQHFLKRGEMTGPDGELIQVEKGHKFDNDALAEMYPETMLARPPLERLQGMTRKEGLHPDLVAQMFGFTSGDQLVREILAAEPEAVVIEGLIDQRMLERYGELTDQQSIERAADAAIHNDARAKFIATELRALNKATGQRNILAKAAKSFAETIIARKKVRDVKPSQYSAAEARAGRAAEQATDLVEKATQKRNQLVNHYAARAAHDALAEVEKAVAHLKRLDSAGARKAIDPEYMDQIDQMIERFDLRSGQTLKAIDKRTALADWIKAQEALGFEPTISDELRNEAFRKSFKDMTVEEVRGLVDAVKNIEHLGRLKKKLLTLADEREFEAVVDEIVGSIAANATGTVAERRASDRGFMVDKVKLFKNFMADHRKFASLAREMDGWQDAGKMWDYFVRAMNKAGDAEAVQREQATIKLGELLKPVLKAGGLTKKQYFASAGKSFTREERISLALNMGNEVNRERIVTGEGLTPQALTEILDTLTKEDWDFVQGVWTYLESFKPQIAAKQRRLTGSEPEWVDAAPVRTKFGEYKGGYYPIKYDPERSSKSNADSAAEVQRQLERGLYTRAQTRRGHLESRTESTGRPLRYDFATVITQHVDQVVHDLAWHEYLIDANRLLKAGGRIDQAIREHYGPEKLRVLTSTLTDIAVGDLAAQSGGDKILNGLRHGATVAGLGWRVTTSLLQPLGLTQSMVRIGPKWVLKGAMHWMGDATHLENSMTEISAKSDFMRLRAKTMQREINEIRNKVSGKDSKIEASYFYLIQKMQLVADIPTWFGAYEKAMAEVDTEAKAIALADQAVRDAQGHGQIADLAPVQRGSAGWKLFTNFYSFFNTTYNLTRESVGRTDFKKPGDVALLAADLLLLYTVPAMLGTLMKAALGGDWDDEKKLSRKLIADQLNYLLGTVVLVRELNSAIQAALGLTGDYGGPASVRFFQAIAKLAKQANQGEADEPFWKALNEVGGTLFHYPAGQINATASGLAAMADGKTSNPGALLVGAPKP